MAKDKKDDKSNVGYTNFNQMCDAHNGVFKSLVEKDGLYKTAEAKEINNAFGKQIGALQLKMEAYRMLGEKPGRDDLMLPETKAKAPRGKKK
tara:strand:- start:2378 stop:2653 length:276 start_codon:yes stop_codon:yes gene_type:complete